MEVCLKQKPLVRHPWLWVPSLYVAEGVPYIIAMTVSVVLYKKMGISNTNIALYTSWFYLPWVLKPLWSPMIDMYHTKRAWIVAMQFSLSLSLFALAAAVPVKGFFLYTVVVFWLMAFSSATHDIAADGFYMIGLKPYEQAAFVGVRTIFYRIASVAAQGGIVILAGFLEMKGFSISSSWSAAFFVVAALFFGIFLYHGFVLPYPATDRPAPAVSSGRTLPEFIRIIALFFRKKDMVAVLAFFLFYRFAETQLVKMVVPFLLDPPAKGGLGLTTSEVGFTYGTVGVISLML